MRIWISKIPEPVVRCRYALERVMLHRYTIRFCWAVILTAFAADIWGKINGGTP